jgi:S-(hydroxymethyl)glutathione dehydrogenase/alcohol dehydrogenase
VFAIKAMVYKGIKNIRLSDAKDPIIENYEDIIIKVTSTSICGSDLHLLHGFIPNLQMGTVIGHEAMGIVEETGKRVTKIKKGDRVIVPFPVSCGHCWFCKHDLSSQCDNSNDFGESGGVFGYGDTFGGYDGGQAEYLRVPYANFGPRIIEESLTDEQVLFATDILPTAYWGIESAGVKQGDTVVVLGCGPVGQLAQKFAWLKGAERVIAVDNIPYRLQHAQKYNKAEVINFDDYDNTGAYIKEITKGGADAVIDCVGMEGKMTAVEKIETVLRLQGGSKSAIEIASLCVRKGGTIMLVGVYGAKYNAFPLGELFSRNITLKMGQCPAHSYVDPVLKMIEDRKIDATDIITHTMPLSDGDKAYDIFEKRQDNCIKVILKP